MIHDVPPNGPYVVRDGGGTVPGGARPSVAVVTSTAVVVAVPDRKGRLWPIERALVALQEANRHVAGFCCCESRKVAFEFVPLIEDRRAFEGGLIVIKKEVLGRCHRGCPATIWLVAGPRWPETALHELVHLYCPDRREAAVEKIAREAGRALRLSLDA